MNVFNIIGPVMIGPSSSHTAGAVRIGRVAHMMINGRKIKKIEIELSGSFAQTYKGHGTDRALMAGIMGYETDSIEIRDALRIADERGINYEFIPTDIPGAHPNTARIKFELEDGTKGSLIGVSIGGGNIRIDQFDGMNVRLAGDETSILVLHRDVPGVIAEVTHVLAQKYKDINICNFTLGRQEKGGVALMTMGFDNPAPDGLKEDLEEVKNVLNVIIFRAA